MIHALLAAFDALAWWQQLGIGAVALACCSVAVGTAYFMREIVVRAVDSAAEQARADADRLADEPPRLATFKEPAAKGLASRRPYQRSDFGTEERRASLRGQRRRSS